MRCIRNLLLITIAFLGLFLKGAGPAAAALTSFGFDDFTAGGAKIAGLPFLVKISALDENGLTITSYDSLVNLTDNTTTVYPNQIIGFVNGVWTGNVYITQAATTDALTVSASGIQGTSSNFSVIADSRIKYLTIGGGNNQNGVVFSQLPAALIAKVVDPYNNPISGVGVNFFLTSYPPGATGQALTALSGTSNASGNVTTTMTLGRKAGTYIVNANISAGIANPINFYETASTDVLTTLTLSPSVGIIPVGGYAAFNVKGYDQFQNERTLPAVTWTVVNGGGTIDGTGIFYGGQSAGTFLNTVKAQVGSVGALASVTLLGSGGTGTGGTGVGNGGSGGTASASATPTASPSTSPEASASGTGTGTGAGTGTGVLNSIVITPDVITALKNAKIPIVADGVDIFGNTVSNVNFNFSVTGNLGTLTQTSANTVLLTASEQGVGTVTITATQGNVTKIAKVVGSVGTGLNRRLVIEAITSPQAVGEPFTISIAAKDSLNNYLTDYLGPIVLADTTGTIDPAVVEPNENGIWYVQAIIGLSHPQVSITAAGDGMIGVSNIFEVTGDPKKSEVGAGGAGAGGGLGDIMGASISGKIKELLQDKSLNKYTVARFIGAGLAAGIGILGASIGGSIMASRGLEALGRNPFAKTKLKLNLYLSIIAFLLAAGLAVVASFLIVK